MSERYTLGFEPSLLLRMEKNPCSPEAKCVLWESHIFQSSELAHAPVASTYAPWFTIYTGTPAALLPYDEIGESSDARRPKMIPVTLVPIPTDFYFAVQQDTLDPIPAVTLTFTVFSKSRTTVPAGATC